MTTPSNFIHPINIFTGIRQQNVTFCVDLSGSMYNTLATVKEHLIQYLLEQSVLADFNVHRQFNLVGFSTEVYPWATSMVLWNKATVNSSLDWIKDLETKTGTNTLDALLTAFADEKCHAISLVTDDLPDQDPFTVLNQISLVANGRPVHCVYILNGREEDRSTTEFLQNIASITKGSMKIVTCDRQGVEKITPISSFDSATAVQLANLSIHANNYNIGLVNSIAQPVLANPHSIVSSVPHPPILTQTVVPQIVPESQSLITVTTPPNSQPVFTTHHNIITSPGVFNTYTYPRWVLEPSIYKYPSFLPRVNITSEGKIPCRAIAWSRYRPVKVLFDGRVVGLTLQDSELPIPNDIAYSADAGSLLLNKTVIARSILDGYYYKGKVMSQLLAHKFMVQFGPNEHGKFKDTYYQNTAIYDIIHYDDTFGHVIKTGDKVLALKDGSERYAPAEVLEGFEKRSSTNEIEKNTANHLLTVRFADGKTRTCQFDEAIWIPDAMHDRIKFELNLPSTARKYLEEYNDDYPNNSLPGYPTNHVIAPVDSVVMPRMIYDIWPYFVPFYPLYSNILYPAVNSTLKSEIANLTGDLSNIQNVAINSVAPNYYRQIRSNAPSVNADCLNRSVVGTTMTPDELDRKIKHQIHLNRHLIIPPSIEPCLPRESCLKKSRHPAMKRCQSSFAFSSPAPPPMCDEPEFLPPPIRHVSPMSPHPMCNDTNIHYNKYQNLVEDLYNDCKKMPIAISKPCPSEIKRAKSVTFCTDTRYGLENEFDMDYEYDDVPPPRHFVNKCRQLENRHKLHKRHANHDNQNIENRFGNPKVTVGLPEKSFYRPRTALSNVNHSADQEIFKSRERFQKENYARREKGTIERLLNETKKQEKREKHRQTLTNQIQDFEKRRSESNYQKGLATANAKKDILAAHNNRIESNKIDMEEKEAKRIQHLRNEAEKREAARVDKNESEIKKEQNRLAFKQKEQENMNANYHNRLIAEENLRAAQLANAQKFHNQNKQKEIARENRGQKLAAAEQSIKEGQAVLNMIN